MLTALSIRDVVLIEALDLDFGAGLSVLTGETGAGKSILLDSLGLALGDRAESGLVRSGAKQASVTACFDAPASVKHLLEAQDIALEPSEPLIIRRSVKSDGGSRAWVNGQPVSASLLREIGGFLVEIHGQHDDRGLINPRGHRALLDSFARGSTALVGSAYSGWREAEVKLATARTALSDAERDREWLEHAVAELQAFAPELGEEAQLAERRSLMQRSEKIAGDLSGVMDKLQGSDGGLATLRAMARALERIAGDHPALAEALSAIDRAIVETDMAEDRLTTAARALSFDPMALEADESRLFDLRALARKHRVQPDELAALTIDLAAKFAAITGGNEGLARLEGKAEAARDSYINAARALSATRQKAAGELDKAVAAELTPLKLEAAQFRTQVETLPQDQWGPAGMDRVEFLISTNPGAPFAPLIKIASGGELSRFILALKVALAEAGGAATMVFDEIDRGVGGAVASAIGDRLARLSDGAQLLVVTHSPQVAARGDMHFLIAKSHDGLVTRTGVSLLDRDARREEIARMLSGTHVTDEARAQAKRLIEPA